jgi:hypothetical protein
MHFKIRNLARIDDFFPVNCTEQECILISTQQIAFLHFDVSHECSVLPSSSRKIIFFNHRIVKSYCFHRTCKFALNILKQSNLGEQKEIKRGILLQKIKNNKRINLN